MDFILHDSAALSKELCNHYIDLYEKNPQCHVDGLMYNEGKPFTDPNLKKCREVYLNEYDNFKPLEPCMSKSVLNYREKYPSVDILDRWNIDPNFKIQKYLPGEGYFKIHCENGSPVTSNRVLAWMIYLNDVYDEGHTIFPNQKRKFQPRAGDLLIWPAHFTHTHHGVTSKSEIKYILTGWFIFIEGTHPWDENYKS